MKRGGCSFATKIQLATRLGARSLVIIDNTDDSTPVMMNTIGKSQTNIFPGVIRTHVDSIHTVRRSSELFTCRSLANGMI